MGSVIIGSGRSLPARVVTNDELSEIVDTTDEWIVPRTGIHTRHVALEETCTDLGAQAALRALGVEEGGWQREAGAIEAATLDMIICPTLTADTHFPSEAARIRERIGAANAVCYDMSCACSGCVYGLSTADLIMAGAAFARQEAARTGTSLRCNDVRRVLVVAAERLSKLVDWEERATCILFGDGAGAVVLEWRDEADGEGAADGATGTDGAAGAAGTDGAAGAAAPGILSSYMENTDDVDRTLWCDSAFAARAIPFAPGTATAAGTLGNDASPAGGAGTPTGTSPTTADASSAGANAAGTDASAVQTGTDTARHLAASDAASDPYMRMAGQAVFKFATAAMMRCTEEALSRAGLSTDDVTLFTPHQANERIIRYAAKKMGLPMERFQVIIDHVGNVSGASALIALNEALCEGKLQPGDIACMTAFGGGLTAGSCVIRI